MFNWTQLIIIHSSPNQEVILAASRLARRPLPVVFLLSHRHILPLWSLTWLQLEEAVNNKPTREQSVIMSLILRHLVNCPFITPERWWSQTHCECERDLQHFRSSAPPPPGKTLTFVFWLRSLIEIVRSLQLHFVYVLVLLCVRSCLGWAERFLYFPSGLCRGRPRIPSRLLERAACRSWSEVCSRSRADPRPHVDIFHLGVGVSGRVERKLHLNPI